MSESTDRTYEIRYLRTAKKDLGDIVGYIRQDSPSAASEFVKAIDRAISNLELNPYLGVVPKDGRLEKMGYRMLVVGKYLAFYKVKGDLIKISRVIHGARRYTFLL